MNKSKFKKGEITKQVKYTGIHEEPLCVVTNIDTYPEDGFCRGGIRIWHKHLNKSAIEQCAPEELFKKIPKIKQELYK